MLSNTDLPALSELKYSIPLSLVRQQILMVKKEEKGLHQIYLDCMRSESIRITFNDKKIPSHYLPDSMPDMDKVKTKAITNYDLFCAFLKEQLSPEGFSALIKTHDQLELGMYGAFIFDFLEANKTGMGGATRSQVNYQYDEKKQELSLFVVAKEIKLHNKDNPESPSPLADLFKNTVFGTQHIQKNGSVERKFVTNNYNIPIELFKFELKKCIQYAHLKDNTNEFKIFSRILKSDKHPQAYQYEQLIEKLSNKECAEKFVYSLKNLDTLSQMDRFIRYCIQIGAFILPQINVLEKKLNKIFEKYRTSEKMDKTEIIISAIRNQKILKMFWSFEALTSAASDHIVKKNSDDFIDKINERLEKLNTQLKGLECHQKYYKINSTLPERFNIKKMIKPN